MAEIADDILTIDTDTDHDGDGDDSAASVFVTVWTGEIRQSANVSFDNEPTPEQVAHAILRSATAAASMHGTDTWFAFQRLLHQEVNR